MSKWYKYIPDIQRTLGKSIERKVLPERFKSNLARTPVVNDIVSRGWVGPTAQQFTPEGHDAYSNSKTSEYLQKAETAAILVALGMLGSGAIGAGAGAGAGGGTAAPIGATGGAGGITGGTEVATAMGSPVTYGQTAQGAGGIFMGTTASGAPMWAGTAPGLGSGAYAGSSTPLATNQNPAKKPESGIKKEMMNKLIDGFLQGSKEKEPEKTPPMEIPTIENSLLPPPAAPLPFNYLNRANPYIFR